MKRLKRLAISALNGGSLVLLAILALPTLALISLMGLILDGMDKLRVKKRAGMAALPSLLAFQH